MSGTPKYKKHVMVCVRERKPGHKRGSCGQCGADKIRKHFADLIKSHGLKGEMRASKTHCLDVCELGPVVVVYPDDTWYVEVKPEDVEAIFEASVLGDGVYEKRLATAETWETLKALRVKSDAQTAEEEQQAEDEKQKRKQKKYARYGFNSREEYKAYKKQKKKDKYNTY